MQLWDSITNGYWHARELTYTMTGMFHTLEWIRSGADAVFLLVGVVPLVYATLRITFARGSSSDLPMADAVK